MSAPFKKGTAWSDQSAAALNDLVARVDALEAANKPAPVARKGKTDKE